MELQWGGDGKHLTVLLPADQEITFAFGIMRGRKAVAGDGGTIGPQQTPFRMALIDETKQNRADVAAELFVPIRTGMDGFVLYCSGVDVRESKVKAAVLRVTFDSELGISVPIQLFDEEAYTLACEAGLQPPAADFSTPFMLAEEDKQDVHHFSAIKVSGLRGFAQEQCLNLAVPDGRPGSGLTVIVGANNSGKSTMVEAVHLLSRALDSSEWLEGGIPEALRHKDTGLVSIKLERNDDSALEVRTFQRGGSQGRVERFPGATADPSFDLHVTPSRRSFSPYFGYVGETDRRWFRNSSSSTRVEARDQFVGRMVQLERDEDRKGRFNALLGTILGEELDWVVDEITSGQQFIRIQNDGVSHTTEGIGDGLMSLFFIVDALYESEPGALIAIDEPELSLHPQLVRKLETEFARYAQDRQIIIATHSPLLVNWKSIENGARVARTVKKSNSCQLFEASVESLKDLSRLHDGINHVNPHAVGSVAMETFFLEDGVVLVEGQEDAVYLPVALDDLGLPNLETVYGWGSGGVGNIPKLAQLFIELGFERIAAILDNDQQPGTDRAYQRLRALGTQVLVVQIPAPDIRFKKAGRSPEVVGLLDAEKKVRKELRSETKDVFRRVLEHVAPEKNVSPR